MRTVAILMAFALIFACPPAGAVTHYVDVNGGGDFNSIGEAFAVASTGDSIVVAPGIYTGANNTDIEWGSRNLVLTAEAGRPSPVIEPVPGRFLLLEHGVTDTSSVIRGFTVMNGAGWELPYNGGGAIVCCTASPLIEDCDFTLNEGENGGAIYLYQSGAVIRRCAFRDNTAAVFGGGVSSNQGAAVVRDCLFLDNWAGFSGAGLRTSGDDFAYPVVRGCTFARNSANDGAGIWYTNGSRPTIDRSIVAFNQRGAGIDSDEGAATEVGHSIIFANDGGDSLPGRRPDNLFVDPLFCDADSDDFTVCADSPALPAYNPWSVEIGAYGSGCPPCDTPVAPSTWGVIKALYRRPRR